MALAILLYQSLRFDWFLGEVLYPWEIGWVELASVFCWRVGINDVILISDWELRIYFIPKGKRLNTNILRSQTKSGNVIHRKI